MFEILFPNYSGLLPTISPLGTTPISSTSPGFNSSALLASPTLKPKVPRGTSKPSSKTSCECPNCHETSRIGEFNFLNDVKN